ncbi:MAG: tetratricopeptide repeat protein [Terriglobales bacterium]
MSDDLAFLVYALLFRFAIIAAGLYTMFLGYSLLRDGQRIESDSSDTRATASVSIPGAKITIKNVTAGSIFSLFGAFLVIAMILQGNPEKTTQRQSQGANTVETKKVRGDTNDTVLSAIQSGLDAQRKGDIDEAETRFRDALFKTAPALNGIAWIYARGGKAPKGLVFSQAAVEIDGSNSHYLDTLAEAQSNMGDQASALKTIKQAAKLDPSFIARVDEFRRRASK